jgi:hypothetical protein
MFKLRKLIPTSRRKPKNAPASTGPDSFRACLDQTRGCHLYLGSHFSIAYTGPRSETLLLFLITNMESLPLSTLFAPLTAAPSSPILAGAPAGSPAEPRHRVSENLVSTH